MNENSCKSGGDTVKLEPGSYFAAAQPAATTLNASAHQAALERCVEKLRATLPVIGVRNPKIGTDDNRWI
jgi:unsaturated chondroitin disaccharide hydrolase